MKNYLSILIVLLMFGLLVVGCGNQHSRQETTTQYIETEITDSMAEKATAQNNIEVLQDSISNVVNGKSLNDIRFGNWTHNDWYDNDYFRALHKYIDACYNGEIKNDDLEPYKSALKGKFAIGQAEPCAFGGMFIYFIFLDAPNKIFKTWIYSDVDENTETVVDYQVRGVGVSEEDSQFTKDDILSIIKEHPENKLW